MRNAKIKILSERINHYSLTYTGAVRVGDYKFNDTQVNQLNQAGVMVRDLWRENKKARWQVVYALTGLGAQLGLQYLDAKMGGAVGLLTYPALLLYVLTIAYRVDKNKKIYNNARDLLNKLHIQILSAQNEENY